MEVGLGGSHVIGRVLMTGRQEGQNHREDMMTEVEVRERFKDATKPAFKVHEGPQANKCRWPLEARKERQGLYSPLKPPEEPALPTPSL